ncbi:MAG: hypothetical protein ACKOEL_06565, partial [Planctomycetota bacterium]
SNKKRDELLKENGDLKALASQLDGAARSMEAQKNAKKQPPQRKSMLRKSPAAKPAPEPEPAAEG